MKKTVAKRGIVAAVILLFVATIAFVTFGGFVAHAAESTTTVGQTYSGRSEGLTTTELYNATNTYNYNGDNPDINI